MIKLLGSLFTLALGAKKGISQVLLVVAVFGGLYWYWSSTLEDLSTAKSEVTQLSEDKSNLVKEVKDTKEQSEINTKAVVSQVKDQGDLKVKQAVAIAKVQHEVSQVLQDAPDKDAGSPAAIDAVSTAVVNGMWDSYQNASNVGGAAAHSAK